MAKFRKAILKTGRYHSPDGVVDVTPERLKHWELQFRRMLGSRQVVPIDWDHADDPSALQPLTMDAYKKRRSAASTIGHLSDFRVSDSGDSAEITLDIRSPKAVEAAALNTVYVSPVLFPEWKDGNGQRYSDVITHVDMVNHPVDSSQSAFVPVEPQTIACALRMSLSTQPYRFGEVSAMADADDLKENEDEAYEGNEMPEEEAAEATTDVTPAETGSTLQDVVEGLAKFNIILQAGTTLDNLLDRLHAALLTAAAHQDKAGEQDKQEDGGEFGQAGAAQVQQPDVAMMSLAGRAAIQWAEEQHRKAIRQRLSSLLSDGRCTPAEKDKWSAQLGSVRLSLDPKTNAPTSSRVEEWIDSREAVPKGTFWDKAQRVRMAREQVIDPPAAMRGELSPDEVSDVVNWALGRKGK